MYLPMLPLNILDITLPLTDPILKFFVILTIILLAPLLLNKISIPPILGLIIAGAVIGPYGINLMERDSSIILSGTAGLLYIMFLAGLEIDLGDFRRNSSKSLLFGMYTFLIPMVLGIVAGLYGLNFSTESSVLLASMFASHTLIAYPIISKYGITKNRAVTVAVGGTIITDTLSLLVLAIIVGMATGEVDPHFSGPARRLHPPVRLHRHLPVPGHNTMRLQTGERERFAIHLRSGSRLPRRGARRTGRYRRHHRGLSHGSVAQQTDTLHIVADESHRVRRKRHASSRFF